MSLLVDFPVWSLTVKDAQGILGLHANPTEGEIKSAYRRLALKFHPDRLPPGTAPEIRKANEETIKVINEAHEILEKGIANGSPAATVDSFVSRFGLFFYAPEQVARLKEFFARLKDDSGNASRLVQSIHFAGHC